MIDNKIYLENGICKFYTILLVIFPLLNIYSIGFFSLTMADVIILPTILLLIIRIPFKNIKINKFYMASIALNIFGVAFAYILGTLTNSVDNFLTLCRYLMYIFCFTFFEDFFNYVLAKKWIIIVAIIATIFIIFQMIMVKLFNIYVKGYLPFLPLTNPEVIFYGLGDYLGIIITPNNIRPRSFFMEPSHYGIYIVVALYLVLFKTQNTKKAIKWTIIMVLGLLISRSSTGIICAIYLLAIKLITLINKYSKIDKRKLYLIFGCALIGVIVIINTSFFNDFLGRIINNGEVAASVHNRFDGFEQFNAFIKLNIAERYFGKGFGLGDIYMTSFIKTLYEGGYCAFLGLLIILGYLLFQGKKTNNLILFGMIIFLGIGTEILNGSFVLILYPFMTANSNSYENINMIGINKKKVGEV
ncbi:MAG: hypothetical protein WCR54_06045 [Clostridia bacterium]